MDGLGNGRRRWAGCRVAPEGQCAGEYVTVHGAPWEPGGRRQAQTAVCSWSLPQRDQPWGRPALEYKASLRSAALRLYSTSFSSCFPCSLWTFSSQFSLSSSVPFSLSPSVHSPMSLSLSARISGFCPFLGTSRNHSVGVSGAVEGTIRNCRIVFRLSPARGWRWPWS